MGDRGGALSVREGTLAEFLQMTGADPALAPPDPKIKWALDQMRGPEEEAVESDRPALWAWAVVPISEGEMR